MILSQKLKDILPQLRTLRHFLHQHPELSGQEKETAQVILEFMRPTQPQRVLQDLGGTGLALVYEGSEPGPTILLRAELDALPVCETNNFAYSSQMTGISHKCGHDGHMAILAGIGLLPGLRELPKGRVVLLFQPAEETGIGAMAVVQDPAFATIAPDYAFALHNLPGKPMGQVLVRPGPFACASQGMVIRLMGKTSHAAHPEDGISPLHAMTRLMTDLTALSNPDGVDSSFRLVTVVHARLGEVAFGTSPGEAVVMATLRTETNEAMDALVKEATDLALQHSRSQGLELDISWRDIFKATVNEPTAVELVCTAANRLGLDFRLMSRPNRWSEDFGMITQTCKGALFTLGAGTNSPQLHNPDYDFPDELLEQGVSLFYAILELLLFEDG